MDIFGIDILVVFLTLCFIVFWGSIFVGFVFYWNKNPYVPRKYFNVIIEDREGNKLRALKGWIMKVKGIPYFRVGLKELPTMIKGIEKDISIIETINKNGEIVLIESVPGKDDAENYTPKNIPITQKEKFIEEIAENISDESRETFKLKVRELIAKHSRLVDLNASQARKNYIQEARKEAERDSSDNIITKYGPILALMMACLFSYLIIDSSIKAYKVSMEQQNAVMMNGYAQIISQCGGLYQPLYAPQNTTEPTKQASNMLPFT